MGSRGINDFVCKGELKIKGVISELKRDVSRFFREGYKEEGSDHSLNYANMQLVAFRVYKAR